MELILGHSGTEHIDAQEFRNLFSGIVGDGNYILHGMEPSVVNANTVRISFGGGIAQGAYFETASGGESVAIDNGTQGMKRHDLICPEYKKTGNTESMAFKVIKGTPSTTPQDPSYTAGTISSGATVQFPFFRVRLNGLSIDGVDIIAPRNAHVVSRYKSGIWSVEKWSDGEMIIEGWQEPNKVASSSWGAGYRTDEIPFAAYPEAFTQAPDVEPLLASSGGAGHQVGGYPGTNGLGTASQPPSLYVFALRNSSPYYVTGRTGVRAKGRWF